MRGKSREYTLTEGNLIKQALQIGKLESEMKMFFQFCPLWKNIRRHIEGFVKCEEGECILIDPPNYAKSIRCYRGTGYGVRFHEINVRGWVHELPSILFCGLSVDWVDEDEEEFTKNYELRIPAWVADDFSRFDEWVSKVKEEKTSKQKEEDLKIFKKIQETYPNWFSSDRNAK